MKKLLIHFYLLLTIHAGSTALAQGQSVSEATQAYASRLLDTATLTDAMIELSDMLGEESNGKANLARQIINGCWNSKDMTLRITVLRLVCDPRAHTPDLKGQVLNILSNERDLGLLVMMGEAVRSQTWTDEEFKTLLRLAEQIGANYGKAVRDGNEDSRHQAQIGIMDGAISSKGAAAYPLLLEYAREHPKLPDRLGSDWRLLLITTSHSDAFRDAFNDLRGGKIASEFRKAALMNYLTLSLMKNFADTSRRPAFQSQGDVFIAYLSKTADTPEESAQKRISAMENLLKIGQRFPEYCGDALACVKRNESAWSEDSEAGYIRMTIKKIEKANQSPK